MLAIDYDVTEDVEIEKGGLVLSVGHIPRAKFQRLVLELEQMKNGCRRRWALSQTAPTTDTPQAEFIAMCDEPQFREEFYGLAREVLRWGVRGVRGFVDAAGEEVPLRRERVQFMGRGYEVLHPDYAQLLIDSMPDFLAHLSAAWAAAWVFNTLTEADARKSPRRSEPTAPGSDAPTAP